MSDRSLLGDQLEDLAELAKRVVSRIRGIGSAEDFEASEDGRVLLDAICLVLLAIGEMVKKIEKNAGPEYLADYGSIPWKEIKGARDFMAHEYYRIDPAEVYRTCAEDIPKLIGVLEQMRKDLDDGPSS